MFGLSVGQLAAAAATLVVLETVLCWASVALADGPEVRLPKLALLGGLVVAVCGSLSVLIFYVLVGLTEDPFAAEKVWRAWTAVAASLLLLWLVPTLLYVPLAHVSVRKGAWTAVLQWLLRVFLAALIAGFVFVVLAALQIVRRDSTSQAPAAPAAPTAPARLL